MMRLSQDLIDLLLYLLDARGGELGLSDATVQGAIRAVLDGHGGDLRADDDSELVGRASRGLWALILDAERHLLHVGELHQENAPRLLSEARRLLIDRGYYRKRLLLDAEPAEFELNGSQWLWANKTTRRD